ncbi:MAG: hypothetical protein M3321_00090 [Actinomycetota bacterium]|nr:hypothetical protein [Actinomycetota bacterium]
MHDAPTPRVSKIRVARDPYPAPPDVARAAKRAARTSKREAAQIKKQLGRPPKS